MPVTLPAGPNWYNNPLGNRQLWGTPPKETLRELYIIGDPILLSIINIIDDCNRILLICKFQYSRCQSGGSSRTLFALFRSRTINCMTKYTRLRSYTKLEGRVVQKGSPNTSTGGPRNIEQIIHEIFRIEISFQFSTTGNHHHDRHGHTFMPLQGHIQRLGFRVSNGRGSRWFGLCPTRIPYEVCRPEETERGLLSSQRSAKRAGFKFVMRVSSVYGTYVVISISLNTRTPGIRTWFGYG